VIRDLVDCSEKESETRRRRLGQIQSRDETRDQEGLWIPLKFTTTDGQELPLLDYAAVPRELLRKLEEIAIRARELTAAHKAAILGGTSNIAEKAMSDLTKELSALEEIWDFEASCIRARESGPPSDTPEIDSDKARIQAGH
jgi:hypothetical protein